MKLQRITQWPWAIVLAGGDRVRRCKRLIVSIVVIGWPDGATGWADLGNQIRVIDTLDRHVIEPEWLWKMRRSNVPVGINVQVHEQQQTIRAVMQDTVTYRKNYDRTSTLNLVESGR